MSKGYYLIFIRCVCNEIVSVLPIIVTFCQKKVELRLELHFV